MFESGWLWSYTFFRNNALRSEYPRLRDVGESGDRLPVVLGETGVREAEVPALYPDPSPSPWPSGETSRVFTVKSGVPGLLPDVELFP
jgi:hypothetical protein